jgi:hypothetical protein
MNLSVCREFEPAAVGSSSMRALWHSTCHWTNVCAWATVSPVLVPLSLVSTEFTYVLGVVTNGMRARARSTVSYKHSLRGKVLVS